MMVALPAVDESELYTRDTSLFKHQGFSILEEKGSIIVKVDPKSEAYIKYSNILRYFQDFIDEITRDLSISIIVPSYIDGYLTYAVSYDEDLESIMDLNYNNEERQVTTQTDRLIDAIRRVAQKFEIDGVELFNSIKPFLAYNTTKSSFIILSQQLTTEFN